jgi:hypothetical protein
MPQHRPFRIAGAASAAAVLLSSAACTADATGTIGNSGDPATGERADTITAPLDFASDPLVRFVSDAEFVDGDVLYALYSDPAEDRILMFDMATGAPLGEAAPHYEGTDSWVDSVHYAFSAIEDTVVLFVLFVQYEIGELYRDSGSASLRLNAFDAVDGTLLFTRDEAIPGMETSADGYDITIDADDGDHVLVSVRGRIHGHRSFLFDATAGDLVWDGVDIEAVAYRDGMVSGFTHPAEIDAYAARDDDYGVAFQVVSTADGTVHWNSEHKDHRGVDAWPLGDGLVLVVDDVSDPALPDAPKYVATLVDTGDATAVMESLSQERPECRYDRVAVLACLDLGVPGLAAWNATDGTPLWSAAELDLVESAPPDGFLAEHGGVLYMEYKRNGIPPVAVEAATGGILAGALPERIVQVGDGYCLSADGGRDRTVSVYREA